MKIELQDYSCKVTKEHGDIKFSGNLNAAGESRLFYHMKPILESITGRKWIKKRMWKDGHMVDDIQQYLRTANKPYECIYNSAWAIESADDTLNRTGEVTLTREAL